MKKIIVITSIYEPTLATKKFSEMEGWELVVVGDTKTPHAFSAEIWAFYMPI